MALLCILLPRDLRLRSAKSAGGVLLRWLAFSSATGVALHLAAAESAAGVALRLAAAESAAGVALLLAAAESAAGVALRLAAAEIAAGVERARTFTIAFGGPDSCMFQMAFRLQCRSISMMHYMRDTRVDEPAPARSR